MSQFVTALSLAGRMGSAVSCLETNGMSACWLSRALNLVFMGERTQVTFLGLEGARGSVGGLDSISGQQLWVCGRTRLRPQAWTWVLLQGWSAVCSEVAGKEPSWLLRDSVQLEEEAVKVSRKPQVLAAAPPTPSQDCCRRCLLCTPLEASRAGCLHCRGRQRPQEVSRE